MKQFRPCRAALRAIRLILILTGAFLSACIAYISVSSKATAISCIVIAAIVFITAFIYLPLYFSSIKYTVSDTEASIKRGIFIKRSQSIKFSSVQYTTVVNFSLAKLISFSSVIFFVYGGKMRISFLDGSDMRELMRISGREE